MRLLVLYEELAPYFLNSIKVFSEKYSASVLIISKSINPVAPFHFDSTSNSIQILNRENFHYQDLLQKIKEFEPNAVMQSGWVYRPYFDIIKQLHLQHNILLLDNQWIGSIKQYVGSIFFRLKYKALFQKAFVPGNKQKQFAAHLGFTDNNIEMGFYCCDFNIFNETYTVREKQKVFDDKFLFIGRYAEEKNVQLLYEAFVELCNENPELNYQLVCIGNGDLIPPPHSHIINLGFKQPEELKTIMASCKWIVLPSKFEPWGVVVQETCLAGLPIISSSKVGANEFFVKDSQNGFIFNPDNKEQLKHYLLKAMNMGESEYYAMSKRSREFAQTITPNKWADKLFNLLK